MSASLLARALAELPSVCDVLRDYQRAQIADLVTALQSGSRRVLLQGATGSGKTHTGSAIASAASAAGLRVLVLATRTRLVRQWHERLQSFGVAHGVLAAELPELRDYAALVQVASADTLHRRAVVDKRMQLPPADVVIFDESHLAAADTRAGLLDSYGGAVRLGFSATPARKSGRGLGVVFDTLLCGPSTRELTARGVLVPFRIFGTPIVTPEELKALPKDAANDYQTAALSDLLSRPKLVGDVVSNWLRIANGKRTFCFAVNKAHGAALVEQFCSNGVAAELLTDADEEAPREAVMARLESGSTTVVVNCFLLSYGVDVPALECIVLARPTRSLAMYLQMVGRGLRPAPGKQHCLLIDHGRVVENLGLPHADIEWTLAEGRNVNVEATKRARAQTTEKPRTCPECSHTWLVSEGGNACQQCAWVPAPKSKGVAVQEADLAELELEDSQITVNSPEFERFYREALGYRARTKPQKWQQTPNTVRAAAFHTTREKFSLQTERMPSRFWCLEPLPPTAVTAGWCKHRDIRWARSRARAAA